MAKNAKKPSYVDAGWPQATDGEHVVSELASSRAGALSPFGDYTEFPLPAESLPYTHPHTVINR